MARPAVVGNKRRELSHPRRGSPGPPVPLVISPTPVSVQDVLALQRAIGNRATTDALEQCGSGQPKVGTTNRTGLPDGLKAGVEQLSGLSLDRVRVHFNSPEPARFNALAYTRGTEIDVAPRQERYLAHEAWHVVQQSQGRVNSTIQAKGVSLNDDSALEREADVMGAKALAVGNSGVDLTGGRKGRCRGLPVGCGYPISSHGSCLRLGGDWRRDEDRWRGMPGVSATKEIEGS